MQFIKKLIRVRYHIALYSVTCLFLLTGYNSDLFAQDNEATLRLIVVYEDEGTTVVGANVLLTEPDGDTLFTGVTNEHGYHEFHRIPADTYEIHVSFIGYNTFRDLITLQPDETIIFRPELVRSTEELDEVVVGISRTLHREAGRRTVTSGDLRRIPAPGPGGDLTMYLQTMPSVVTTGDRGGELHIRGGTPAQNQVLVDNLPIVKPFHISNLFSAFPQEIISSVDMYAGGFGAQYTGATSSILDINLRQGNMRYYEGEASLSPYMGSARIEGPLSTDQSSFFFMARHSAIRESGPVLTGEDIPMVFYDMIARVSVDWTGIVCNLTGIYTSDEGRINPVRDLVLGWSNRTAGLRCLGIDERRDHAIDMTIGYSGYSSSETGIDDIGRSSSVNIGFMRFDNSLDLFRLPFDYGVKLEFRHYSAQLDEPYPELTGTGQRYENLDSSLDDLTVTISSYVTLDYQLAENLRVHPGIASQLPLSYSNPTIEPRLRAVWNPDSRSERQISLSAGRYFQSFEAITDERDAGTSFYVYKPVHTRDPLPESLHGILSYQQMVRRDIAFTIEGYGKRHRNIPVAQWTREPGNTLNTALATGLSYGFDTQIEWDTRRLYMSAAYGMSDVTYEASAADLVAWLDRPVFNYNPSHHRKHQFNFIASYEIAGFTAGLSWQYSSGNPFTKIYALDLVLNVPNQNPVQNQGRAVTLYAEPYNDRIPAFHRLDVSIERTFHVSGGLQIDLEAGAINAYNNMNIFYYDVNTMQQVNQMPFLPYASVSARIR
jgi:hypothetical protein